MRTYPAVLVVALLCASCSSNTTEPQGFQVVGVEQQPGTCRVPAAPEDTVIPSAIMGGGAYGPVAVKSAGGVIDRDVRTALAEAAGRESFDVPTEAEIRDISGELRARVMASIDPDSHIFLKPDIDETLTVIELRCRYRADMTRGTKSFAMDLEAGSGIWYARPDPNDPYVR